jgi:hypothetical protein
MTEPQSHQIRSYHRAFHFELTLYNLGNIRLVRPIPARGIFYAAAAEVAMLIAAHLPVIGGPITGLGWEVVYGLIPLSLAWVLTVAKIEGRRFHIAARAWGRHLSSPRHLVGGYRKARRPGTGWRPDPIVFIGDGRDGRAPRGLRLEGPGSVVLRYPCEASQRDATLTVKQTAQVPCDPATVLRIADGATVRFILGRR